MPDTRKIKILNLLKSAFARNKLASPQMTFVKSKDIPLPLRKLLVHDSDMTSTLKKHHGEGLILKVLHFEKGRSSLNREVVLCKKSDGMPVEYGVIGIEIGSFSSLARAAVFEGRHPLGQILDEFQIEYVSCPRDFFRIEHSSYLQMQLQDCAKKERYGRINSLISKDGERLAEVLEILPAPKS